MGTQQNTKPQHKIHCIPHNEDEEANNFYPTFAPHKERSRLMGCTSTLRALPFKRLRLLT